MAKAGSFAPGDPAVLLRVLQNHLLLLYRFEPTLPHILGLLTRMLKVTPRRRAGIAIRMFAESYSPCAAGTDPPACARREILFCVDA